MCLWSKRSNNKCWVDIYFLKIHRVGADVHEEPLDADDDADSRTRDIEENRHHNIDFGDYRLRRGWALVWNQVKAMFLKRGIVTMRSWKFLILQFLIPMALLSIAIASSHAPKVKNLPSLPINYNKYDEPVAILSSDDPDNQYYLAARDYLQPQHVRIDDIADHPVSDYILNLVIQSIFSKVYLFKLFILDDYQFTKGTSTLRCRNQCGI